jgi:hypothetical protein
MSTYGNGDDGKPFSRHEIDQLYVIASIKRKDRPPRSLQELLNNLIPEPVIFARSHHYQGSAPVVVWPHSAKVSKVMDYALKAADADRNGNEVDLIHIPEFTEASRCGLDQLKVEVI